MDKLLELEKRLKEAREFLEKGKLLPKPKATNIPEKKITEYGPKVGIHSGNTISPDKDSGDYDYDYAVNHKTGEVHKKLLDGPHKDMYVPMGHDVNNKPIKKSLDERAKEAREFLEKASKNAHIDHSGDYGPLVGKTKNIAVHKEPGNIS